MRDLPPVTAPRLQRGAEHLHELGPRALAEFLAELAQRICGMPATLDMLAEYQRLSPGMMRAAGGDRFPPPGLRALPRALARGARP